MTHRLKRQNIKIKHNDKTYNDKRYQETKHIKIKRINKQKVYCTVHVLDTFYDICNVQHVKIYTVYIEYFS
jgi:hypothetical protein